MQKLGNDLWHDSKSITNKVLDQIRLQSVANEKQDLLQFLM